MQTRSSIAIATGIGWNAGPMPVDRPIFKDYLLVGLYALVMFGFSMFSGRPLTMHEARLPQCSREMLRRGDWLLPTSGGRPWLERPPLPHWVVISLMKLTGVDDRVWVVRLPSAVMGAITVLLTIYIAGRWIDRPTAIAAGLVLSTTLKFYQYASLAEDDIYLAMLVAAAAAVFTRIETGPNRPQRWWSVLAIDGWSTLLFALLGLTSWTKGPLLGLAVLGPPIAMYAVWRAIKSRSIWPIVRYVRLPAWAMMIGLTVAWPWWAVRHFPDVVDNWKYDYVGRMSGDYTAINQGWWYYLATLPVALLPWTPLAVVAIGRMVMSLFSRAPEGTPEGKRAVAETALPSRGTLRGAAKLSFPVLWAVVPLLIFSIPKGKHDHYLVPFLAPWAILAGVGLTVLIRPFATTKGRWISAGVSGLLLLGFSVGQALFAAPTEDTIDDTQFLRRVRTDVSADMPLYIDAKLGPPGNLDFFRTQFYSRPDAVLIHNLSYLRDRSIAAPVVYVIARERDRRLLDQLGETAVVDQSARSHQQGNGAGKFTLFRLRFNPSLTRYPAPTAMTNLQAMERADGPWCGPPMR